MGNQIFVALTFATLILRTDGFAAQNCAAIRYDWTLEDVFARTAFADDIGNWYVAGAFYEPHDFDPTVSLDVRSPATPEFADLFISKLQYDGTYVWTFSVGGAKNEEVFGIATDDHGNVFIAGGFQDTVDFDPGPGVDQHTSVFFYNAFLTKLRHDGSYLRTRAFEGYDFVSARGVAVDRHDNVVVVGGSATAVIVKLTNDGDYLWNRTIAGGAWVTAYEVAVDANDDIIVFGQFRGTVDFDPGPGLDRRTAMSQPVPIDLFVTKYQSDGTYVWTHTYPAGPASSKSLALQSDGSIFLAGGIGQSTDLDPTAGVDLREGPAIFVTKLNSDGSYGRTYSAGFNFGGFHAIAVTSGGDVLALGSTYPGEDPDFDPSKETMTIPCEGRGSCHFLFCLDPKGKPKWVKGTQDNQGTSLTMTLSDAGEVYYSTAFVFETTFDTDMTCGVDQRSIGFDTFLGLTKLRCIDSTGDSDSDGDVDLLDLAAFQNCFEGSDSDTCSPGCDAFDLHSDNRLDLLDYSILPPSITGPLGQ
ncbi:MAG: hypothetical protein AABZ47_08165 [Planctomycetota bacterium]